ncbi:MAG: sugar transferase [Parcubacteria group bacterium]|nr:sugar transferase [Parcubacteria group bacterium]
MIGAMAIRRLFLLFGDIAIFYLALFLSLWIRWQGNLTPEVLREHILPFSIILAVGLVIFYSMRLYDSAFGYGTPLWLKSTSTALILQFLGAVLFFYFFARGEKAISPRGTLFLFFLVFTFLFLLWRKIAESLSQGRKGERILIFANPGEAKELAAYLREHPELGYRVAAVLPESELQPTRLKGLIEKENLEGIITSRPGLEKLANHSELQELALLKINFWDLAVFYEAKLGKIPPSLVSQTWIVENIFRYEPRLHTDVKEFFDFLFAAVLLIITLPFWPIIALLVKLTSPGPIFIRQERVGRDGKRFAILKFRTMFARGPGGLAETTGPVWAKENDERITALGRALRQTHLDELPQLISILKGDLSFVGPRPERPEFVKDLKEKIPFYDVRHSIKPGFTGWAQINYPYGASVEDAKEKLQYDLYYLKHRSLLLDLSILFKTLRLLFYNPQK